MLKKGMFLRHKNFMDVCLQIQKPVILTQSKALKIRAIFWNMAFVESFFLHIKKSFRIERKDYSDWLFYSTGQFEYFTVKPSLRNAEWRELNDLTKVYR